MLLNPKQILISKFQTAGRDFSIISVASDFSRTKKRKRTKNEIEDICQQKYKIYKTFGKSHSPRLKEIDYKRLIYPVHVIIGTNRHRPFFLKKEFSKIIIDEIRKFDELIVSWCLMPDHLHLLINPDGEEIDLLNIIKLLKGRTSRRFNRLYGVRKIWQESFYDHILRKEVKIEEVALYILNNPVRKGAVNDWQEYPYSWSRYFYKE